MNNQNSQTKKPLHQEIGAIWQRVSYNGGQKYMSGYVEINGERVDIVAFPNKWKEENEKQPDFRVYLSEQKLARNSKPSQPKAQKPKPTKPVEQQNDETGAEDIEI